MMLKKEVLSGLVAAALVFGTVPAWAEIQVNPIKNISPDFIKGADVSMLSEMESKGAKYYDVDGKQADALQIMKNHGINWIRVRVWVAPEASREGGYTTEARGIKLAERAKKLGMKVLLDFHYTDFWADGNQQYTPKPWAKMDADTLNKTVYDYTKKVLTDFKAAGAEPDMVQVGNEVMAGFLWPTGKLPSADNGAAFARLTQSGLSAVHDFDANIQTMIHLQDGGNNEAARKFLDQLVTDNGVKDFDIIGLSYYPFWHGPFSGFQKNADDLSARYGKAIVVAETAFPYTLDDPDANVKGGQNHCNAAAARTGGLLPTVQGQATGLRTVMQDVADIPNGKGLGIFYWAPDWYCYPGVGWTQGEGNNWDNLAMFDRHGKALESWDVFKDVSDASLPTVEPTVDEIGGLTAVAMPGVPVTLPKTAFVTLSDDSTYDVPVKWSNAVPVFDKEGSYDVIGTLEGYGDAVTCTVKVAQHANLVKNGDFETVDFTGWKQEGTSWLTIDSGDGNAIGKGAAHYWSKNAFEFTLSQDIANVPDGVYTAEVETQGKGDTVSYELFVIGDNGERKSAPIKDAGWSNWSTTKIKDITVKNGKVTIGVTQKGNGDNWGSIDNIKFYRQ